MTPETTQALIAHLSKEIEFAVQMILEQRTKNNLVVALGPFIILGAIAASSHALELLGSLSRKTLLIASIFLLASYGALGYLSAQIELTLWVQANVYREKLGSLCELGPAFLTFPPTGLVATYIAIYMAIGLAFLSIFMLIISIRRKADERRRSEIDYV